MNTHNAFELKSIRLADTTLYHGSNVAGIRTFKPAEETTIGEGLYTLDNPEQAAGYGIRRSQGGDAYVYRLGVERARLVDLDDEQTLQSVVRGFRGKLFNRLIHPEPKQPYYEQAALIETIDKIDAGIQVGRVKDVAWHHGPQFTDHARQLGFDGIKASEGGEANLIGNHETYLLFDPAIAVVHDVTKI